jgi:Ni/Co efflux regulator RcnB
VRLSYGYWRARPWVNWRAHYLWAPPYGYQWVYVDGYYMLIAIGTGLIADIVAAY